MKDRIQYIAMRTGVDVETVEFYADEFHHTGMVPILGYLERRMKTMAGDENPRYELEQIRLDLAALSTLAALRADSENTHENS